MTEQTIGPNTMVVGEMNEGQLAKEIYDTVNRLNALTRKAVSSFGFTIHWEIKAAPSWPVDRSPCPHLDMTVLAPVEPE